MRTHHHIALLIAATAAAGSSFAAGCEPKEYAQYKDQARTKSGQISMAEDFCTAKNRRSASMELAKLASEHGHRRDFERAMADESTCASQMSKIGDALRAAKANAGLARIVQTCSEATSR